LAVNVMPVGKVPVPVMVGGGFPDVVTVKVNGVPTRAVAAGALVKTGGAAAAVTVSVNDCVAVPLAFVAVNVNGYVPAAVVVPASVAVPFVVFGVKVIPLGSVPELVIVEAGKPVVVTVKLKLAPEPAVAELALVNAGAWSTVSVNAWAVVPAVLWAVNVIGYVPPAVAAGVPASVPVPSVFAVNVTPAGNVPVDDSVGVGEPDVVTAKLNGVPAEAVVDAGLVNVADSTTVNVTCSCTLAEPLVAVTVIG
jgi:hypothetical protein